MIKLENVSMRFNLGIEKEFSIKQAFVNFFSFKKKNKKKKEYFWALQDISFEVKRGEVIGLIGSNGAGKSTMLKVVSGVMKPTKGKVTINGAVSPMIELGAGFDSELTAKEKFFTGTFRKSFNSENSTISSNFSSKNFFEYPKIAPFK